MCYWIRQEKAELESAGTVSPTPGPERWRPRVAGAIAAALMAGLATAALVSPTSTQPLAAAQPPQQGAVAPVVAKAATTPPPLVIEQTSISGDDGVPSSPDTVRSAASHCHDM